MPADVFTVLAVDGTESPEPVALDWKNASLNAVVDVGWEIGGAGVEIGGDDGWDVGGETSGGDEVGGEGGGEDTTI